MSKKRQKKKPKRNRHARRIRTSKLLEVMAKKNKNQIHPTRIFKKPEDLYNAFCEYKESLKEESKQWLNIQYVGKEGNRVTDGMKIPYTLEGFERYCYSKYGNVGQYFDNKQGYYEDFVAICSRVKNEIRENQIVGGLLGVYNPSITQRLNSLTDKQQTTIIEQPLFPEDK